MSIFVDTKRKVTVDDESGEYMVFQSTHWQDPCDHFTIYEIDGAPIFATEVQIEVILDAPYGPTKAIRYIVRRAWFPSGKPERPIYFLGKTHMIERLAVFVRVWHDSRKRQGESPAFEFLDGRADWVPFYG